MNETNEKIRSFFRQNIGYFVVLLVAIAYVAKSLVTLDETGKLLKKS